MNNKLMCLGPARPFDLPLNSRAVLAGDPEQVFPQIIPFFKTHPFFRKLFTPISEIPKTKAALALDGSALSTIYKNIKAASDAWRKEKANG